MDGGMTKNRDTTEPQSPTGAIVLKRGQSAQAQRDKRSKLALKSNMARRKAQMRARDTEAAHQSGTDKK